MKIYSCTHSSGDTSISAGSNRSDNSNNLYALDTDAFSVEVDPIERRSHHAVAETAAFGALRVARIETTAAVVKRKRDPATDAMLRRFNFIYVIEGELSIGHHLGMSKLKAGEFTLMDNGHARTMFVYNQVSLLLITLPRQMLQRYVPVPEEMEAVVLQDALLPDNKQIFAPILVLWEHMKKGSLRDFAPDISDEFLHSIAQAYGNHCELQGSVQARRAAEARHFIEAQLGNPDLTVSSIAQGLGVCTRYIRFLFKDSEKPSRYILRRRLEESAKELTNILNQNVSIADIAFRCGFNNAAHFSRTFHEYFGETPRDYRRRHLGDCRRQSSGH